MKGRLVVTSAILSTDIKYIKELPGYFEIKTTERHLHVKREKLVCIQRALGYLVTII